MFNDYDMQLSTVHIPRVESGSHLLTHLTQRPQSNPDVTHMLKFSLLKVANVT